MIIPNKAKDKHTYSQHSQHRLEIWNHIHFKHWSWFIIWVFQSVWQF